MESEVDMLDEIKRGLLSGLGAVILTKEKIEEISRKMTDDAKLSKEDAQKLKKELLAAGERDWDRMEKSVSDVIKKGLENLDLCPRSEVQELRARLERLERRLLVSEISVQEESEGV